MRDVSHFFIRQPFGRRTVSGFALSASAEIALVVTQSLAPAHSISQVTPEPDSLPVGNDYERGFAPGFACAWMVSVMSDAAVQNDVLVMQ